MREGKMGERKKRKEKERFGERERCGEKSDVDSTFQIYAILLDVIFVRKYCK